MPTKDEEVTVAPEAEESPQETLAEEPPAPPAQGWFTAAAEPEGEPESAPFAPEASSLPPGHVSGAEAAMMMAAGEPPPPPGRPEPEPEFEPEPEC